MDINENINEAAREKRAGEKYHQFRFYQNKPGLPGKNTFLVSRRGEKTGNDKLPYFKAGKRRSFLRKNIRADERLGMPLRQIQTFPLQGQDMRALRRGNNQGESQKRKNGTYPARRSRVSYLVFQRYPVQARAGFGHRSPSA